MTHLKLAKDQTSTNRLKFNISNTPKLAQTAFEVAINKQKQLVKLHPHYNKSRFNHSIFIDFTTEPNTVTLLEMAIKEAIQINKYHLKQEKIEHIKKLDLFKKSQGIKQPIININLSYTIVPLLAVVLIALLTSSYLLAMNQHTRNNINKTYKDLKTNATIQRNHKKPDSTTIENLLQLANEQKQAAKNQALNIAQALGNNQFMYTTKTGEIITLCTIKQVTATNNCIRIDFSDKPNSILLDITEAPKLVDKINNISCTVQNTCNSKASMLYNTNK